MPRQPSPAPSPPQSRQLSLIHISATLSNDEQYVAFLGPDGVSVAQRGNDLGDPVLSLIHI